MDYMANANISPAYMGANVGPSYSPANAGPAYVSPASLSAPAYGGNPMHGCPNVMPYASHHKPLTAGARYTSTGAILVLFILLVIITRKFCD